MAKVVKVVTSTGVCLQDYGAEINDVFARGTKEQCLASIRRDILWNAGCCEGSGSMLVFVNGEDVPENISENELKEFVETHASADYVQHVIRLQADDVYSTVYEITYQIFEDEPNKTGTEIVKVREQGRFEIIKCLDNDYPGVDVEFIPTTGREEQTLPRLVFEWPEGDALKVLIWGNPENEDPSETVVFKGYGGKRQ